MKSRSPKEPGKLLLQLIWFQIVLLPTILWGIIKNILPSRRKSLKGEVILITGAGNGLGRELALRLAKKGCKLALVDIDAEAVQNVAKEINQEHKNMAKSYVANLGKPQDIKRLSQDILGDCKKVDILINNAGLVFAGCRTVDLRDHEIDGMFQVNVMSQFRMIREFLPNMLERNHGHVVAISSLASYGGGPCGSLYVSSKWAVTGLMHCIRDELREIPGNRVNVSVACPTFFSSNTEISNMWDLRLPAISTKQVANAVINAVQTNKFEFSVPAYMYWVFQFLRLVPLSVRDHLASIFTVHIPLLSPKQRDNLNIVKIMDSVIDKRDVCKLGPVS